jgi:hypothetical protein
MEICMHTSNQPIDEQLLQSVRQRLQLLLHLERGISKADVFFFENNTLPELKTCDIRLSIGADEILVHRKGLSFDRAAGESLKTLRQRLEQRAMLADQKRLSGLAGIYF